MLIPIVYPYKISSISARSLAKELHTKRVYSDRNYYPKRNHLIINWGSSVVPQWWNYITDDNIINHPIKISIAANKRDTFDAFIRYGVSHPEWSDCTEWAQSMIDEGHKVFGRKSLTSHSGEGIIIFDSETICTNMECPLYVKAVKKDKEYRVHVFQGNIIDFQLKKKKLGFEGGTNGIRNHTNGWVYARSDVELPETVANESIKAVQALGLDFGAVDVCTDRESKVFVFEVNTAPGLYNSTLDSYVRAFRNLL